MTQMENHPKKPNEPKTWHSRPRLWSIIPARRDVLTITIFYKTKPIGHNNHEKTKRTQNVAQSPSAVVIHPGPKGRPNF